MNTIDKNENGNPLTVATIEPQKEILVYATSIETDGEIKSLRYILDKLPGIMNWNIDMEDWERVLRIESKGASSASIRDELIRHGICIEELQ